MQGNFSNKAVVFYSIVVAFGGFIFGLDAALISGTVRYITAEFNLSDLEIGTVVSAPGFGVIFALLATGYISNAIGRQKTLLIIAALYLVSAICSVIAPNYTSLVVARFVGGLAFTSLSLASMYIGEIAKPTIRGKLASLIQINIVIGLLAAYSANYFIFNAAESGANWVVAVGIQEYTWRWMLGVEIIPALIWFGLLFKVPESPRWLVLKGRDAEAKNVLDRLVSVNESTQMLQSIKQSTSAAASANKPLKEQVSELFDMRVRMALVIGFTVAVVQQVSGINAIMFYSTTVFEQIGLGTDSAYTQSVIIGLVSVVATFLALMLIDKLGRRPLMLFGLFAAIVSLLSAAWGFADATYVLTETNLAQLPAAIDTQLLQSLIGQTFNSDIDYREALKVVLGDVIVRDNEGALLQAAIQINGMLVLFGIMGFIAAFQFSIGPVMWVLFSEIFPTHVRGIAIPAVALITSIVSYLVQQFFPWQLKNMGAAEIFSFYAFCLVIGLVFLIKLMPETKNKTIEEIELALNKANA
ncbi:sugar porter family MFS transporter [Algibacillus agarilyticus]|uniref:sugar porter family MFS transporter n=1 Tax=Algibacillus agarilyticus TaxID=2234133 RepID=UPI000DD0E36F|nr:sugar porter family MFS transporter [Algibacillus agarilyticus]